MRELGVNLISITVQSLELVARAELVREVLGARTWVPIPGARPDVPGVVLWGGRAVALVDLARFQPGLVPLAAAEQRARLLVMSHRGLHLALPVDRVSEVWRTHDDNLKPRELHDFALARHEIVASGSVRALLDPDLLLRRLDVEVAA